MKLFLFFILLFFLPLVSASIEIAINQDSVGVINLETPTTINYSTVNVNNSQFLQGLTPQEVADLYNETDPVYTANAPTTYLNLSGTNANQNINITTYNLQTQGTFLSRYLNVSDNAQLGDDDADIHGMNIKPTSNVMFNSKFASATDNTAITGYILNLDYTGKVNNFAQKDHNGMRINILTTGDVGMEEGYATNIIYGDDKRVSSSSNIDSTGVDAGQQRLLGANTYMTYSGNVGGLGTYASYNYFGQNQYSGTSSGWNPTATQWGSFLTITGNMGTDGLKTKYGNQIQIRGTSDNSYGIHLGVSGAINNWALYNGNSADNRMGTDDSFNYRGSGNDAYDTYNATDWVFNPKSTGTGKMFVLGDLVVINNFTGNQIYAEGCYHNHTGTILNFATANTNYTLWFDKTKLNGFKFAGGFGIESNFTAQVSGRYQVIYSAIGDGQNNHKYVTMIFINGAADDCCDSHKKMAAGGDITTMGGNCFIDLAIDDVVQLKVMDDGGTGTGNYYGANINFVRIGD